MRCLPNILSLYLLCMYLDGLWYVNVMYNLKVDVHTYIQDLLAFWCGYCYWITQKPLKCFNLFRFLYWATMTCSEQSEQQQPCVLHKLVNILIQSSNYGGRVFVWRIKTNFASRQRRLKSYMPLPLKICLQPQTKLWYSSFSTLFRLSSNSYHESTFHSVRSAQLWVLRLHGIGWGKPHFYFTSD